MEQKNNLELQTNPQKKYLEIQQNDISILSKVKEISEDKNNIVLIEIDTDFKTCLSERNIKAVFKGRDQIVALSTIDILIRRFINSFGFASEVPEERISILVSDTFDNFSGESLSDIILFFKMARNGYFGTTHRGIDSNLIFGDWFPKYLDLKSQEREKEVVKQQKAFKSDQLSIDDVKKSYEKQTEKSFLQRVCDYVDKITDEITRDQLEKLISEWSKDEEKNNYLHILKNKRTYIK